MEAGPRNTAHGEPGQLGSDGPDAARTPVDGPHDHDHGPHDDGPRDYGPHDDGPRDYGPHDDGPRDDSLRTTPDGVVADGPDELDEHAPDGLTGSEVEVELRPRRLLRIWQIAPVVILAATGSLMFAFPLAFEFGEGGPVVAMLGLLLCSCAAGWGTMAARRVGYTWPGLPARGSGRRPDWRVIALYAVVVAGLAVLAVWRVARLR
ncbi:hypothetical protein QIS99_09190 [Streptomyces sp. B-S-A8]|uniref:Transmembrane protein n=2 Tax=Streptomyces solicavernae TaxID=3043614 RepID=A0ABT6RPN6_9ACTN|nr:hypothetical protein [Streptomyces sp. B-S-A8]MDI3386387.1 hypothetical protein [Streptomyces sp. B-S-A8]